MTKEELEKEARINLKRRFGEFFPQLTISYVMGAEPREKRIKELEKACEETQELLDKQIEATYKLDKENAELKKDKKELCHSISEGGKACVYLNEQLTKAKVALRNVIDYLGQFCSDYPDCVIEAEKILKEE